MDLLTPDELDALVDKNYPNRNWTAFCEAFRFQGTRLSNGLATMQSFASAKVARLNSHIDYINTYDVEPGGVGFWNKTVYEHDMLCFGNDIYMGATSLGDTIKNYGGGIKLLHGSSYPATFFGGTAHVGPNPVARLANWEPMPQPPVPPASKLIGNTNNSPEYHTDGKSYEFWVPDQATQLRVQKGLHLKGRYNGKLDGKWGDLSIKGIQETCANVGYSGGIDGDARSMTSYYVQVYAKKFGKYTGPTDHFLGQHSWNGFALGLELP